jgi:hypothetical protein
MRKQRGMLGLAHIKEEDAPAHPEDVYIHCGCQRCEIRWQRQLAAYNNYHRKSHDSDSEGQ